MNKKGFTLTEILIVLVVAGILLALILPNTLKAIERANVTAHESNLNSIQVALFMCFTQEQDWEECGDQAALTEGNFIDEWPEHPFQGEYDVIDNPDEDGATGKVACSGGSVDLPEDAPEDSC